jgi:hypothetical protein
MALPRRPRRRLRGPSRALEQWRRFLFETVVATSLLAGGLYLMFISPGVLAVPAVLGLVGFAVRLVRG